MKCAPCLQLDWPHLVFVRSVRPSFLLYWAVCLVTLAEGGGCCWGPACAAAGREGSSCDSSRLLLRCSSCSWCRFSACMPDWAFKPALICLLQCRLHSRVVMTSKAPCQALPRICVGESPIMAAPQLLIWP